MPTSKKSVVGSVDPSASQNSADSAGLPPGSGLVYISDDLPGLSRLKSAASFSYRDAQGKAVTDAEEIQRIHKLAIPPAYERVWICPKSNGHLQATGYDARGRKQYRYHADWQTSRNESKFERLQAFGQALPRIRARVARDLAPHKNRPLSRSLVLATLVRLLDTTFVRVGNDAYARENGSYGLTTLRNPHAGVRGSTLRLRFRGKSGVMQDLEVDDPKVATVVRRCQQLPGQLLFQYEDDKGELHAVGSSDVNDYLAQITQGRDNADQAHFTAKDFRTWHGTAQALELTRLACKGGDTSAYNAKEILTEVARQLGNTPAVCKKSYIHPAVLALGSQLASDAGAMASIWDKLATGKTARRLQAAEARLLAFLKVHERRKARGEVLAKASATRQRSAQTSLQTTIKPATGKAVKTATKAGARVKPDRLSSPTSPVRALTGTVCQSAGASASASQAAL